MKGSLTVLAAAILLPLSLASCASAGGGGGGDDVRRAVGSQAPQRPYSQAVIAGDLVFFSGKIGVSAETRGMESGRTAAEVRNIMESFRELFAELGLELGDAVQATIYLAEIGDYNEMNDAYGEYFPTDPPARETIAVKDIVAGASVEISFVAVRR